MEKFTVGVDSPSSVADEKSQPQANDGAVKNATANPTTIKVIGCGGGGGNAINNMVEAGVKDVYFIAMNTDLQHLSVSKADYKLQIGKKLTEGLGAGMHPEIGEEAAKEEEETIKKLLADTDMVFITAGMGGGTGTGSAPVVAKIAKSLDILTVAVVTTPFSFEGNVRMRLAQEGIKKLRAEVDSLIIIPNQNIYECGEIETLEDGFKKADDVLRQGVQGISDIITKIGYVNRDFKDVETVMKNKGHAILGIGIGEGENRAIEAVHSAINNKLLDTCIDGAKSILIKIASKGKISLREQKEISDVISANADKDALLIWGFYTEPDLGEKLSVTLIATGFDNMNGETEADESYDESADAPFDDEQCDPALFAEKKDDSRWGLDDYDRLCNPKKTPVKTPFARQSRSENPVSGELFDQYDDALYGNQAENALKDKAPALEQDGVFISHRRCGPARKQSDVQKNHRRSEEIRRPETRKKDLDSLPSGIIL